jgi:hypothetical protein
VARGVCRDSAEAVVLGNRLLATGHIIPAPGFGPDFEDSDDFYMWKHEASGKSSSSVAPPAVRLEHPMDATLSDFDRDTDHEDEDEGFVPAREREKKQNKMKQKKEKKGKKRKKRKDNQKKTARRV